MGNWGIEFGRRSLILPLLINSVYVLTPFPSTSLVLANLVISIPHLPSFPELFPADTQVPLINSTVETCKLLKHINRFAPNTTDWGQTI